MPKPKEQPCLRFSEFNGVEWKTNKLEDIADIRTGPFGSVLHKHDYVIEGTPIITVEHLDDLGISHHNLPLVSDIDKKRLKSYILNTGDLVFSRVGSVDRCSLISKAENGWLFSGRLLRVRFKDQNPEFFNFTFQKETNKQKVRNIAVGQTMPSINTEILKSIELRFPDIKEQKKIAAFLSSVDSKLQALKKKKELLEQYKKGVMQKIFSQELKFKDENGKEFPEWKEKKLGELISELNEKTNTSNQYKVISSTAKGLFNQDEYFTREIASKDNSGYKILRRNQLVFSPQNLWLGNININTKFDIGIVSPSYKIFSFNNGIASVEFCYYYLKTPKLMSEYEQCSEQGASVVRRNLNLTKFLEIILSLPSLEEQDKIAGYLKAIDLKINSISIQIEKLESWKKGLLQQLFV